MRKLWLLPLLVLMVAGCESTTNIHDVNLAKERFAYGKIVNAPRKILEIKGEFEHKCTETEKLMDECSLIVYASNQRYVDVEPQKVDKTAIWLNFLGKWINPVASLLINESNNKWNSKNMESTNEMFTGMFSSLATLKGSGTTTNYTDSFKTSEILTIEDSYKSADSTIQYDDSGNILSGDTLTNSNNVASGDEISNVTQKTLDIGNIEVTSGNTSSSTVIPVVVPPKVVEDTPQ